MSELAPLELEDGSTIEVELETASEGLLQPFTAADVSGRTLPKLRDLATGMSGLTQSLYEAIKENTKAPSKINIEFGVKLGGKTGIILASGSVDSHVKVNLTWSRE